LTERIAALKLLGHDVQLVRRPTREGFKAGALKHGLPLAKGEFIAIFDADFLPDPEFLNRTIPLFEDEKVGVVQTHWEHINRNFSLLTTLQAFALDAHFSVEQVGRNEGGHFINFNGTGGIWRRKTIEDAGGWEADTLTEDLDLSYRAQLKGWKFIYREDIASPAELPVAISALKSQQFRWTKGGAETFKKMAGKLITQKGLRFTDRLHGLAHLFNSSVFGFVFILALCSVPLVYFVSQNQVVSVWVDYSAAFFVSTVLLAFYYGVSFREKHSGPVRTAVFFVIRFIQFLVITMGLAWNNTRAVVTGYTGIKTAFIRTPKFNVEQAASGSWKLNAYLNSRFGFGMLMELLLALYFMFGIILGIRTEIYGMIPFHALLTLGFLAVFSLSVSEAVKD
jgi:cellulose synthase/poly-beta-1,6-N-acetylglucosamine synthase-like glycosyltransferase